MRLHGATSNAALDEISSMASSNLRTTEEVRVLNFLLILWACNMFCTVFEAFDVVLGCRGC